MSEQAGAAEDGMSEINDGGGLLSCDFHVHTNLSWCAAQEMSLEAIAEKAAAAGLDTIGLADHLWLDPKRGCRPAAERLLGLREAVHRLRPSTVRVLVGTEADCAPGLGLAGASAAAKFDFVIASYHFTDIRERRTPWPQSPEELASLLLGGFKSIIESPSVSIVGHPFYIPPSIFRRLPRNVKAGTTAAAAAPAPKAGYLKPDEEAGYLKSDEETACLKLVKESLRLVLASAGPLLSKAAERGIGIEINYKALGPYHQQLLLPLFGLARECGCSFVASSDSHRLAEIGQSRKLANYLKSAGVEPTDRYRYR